MTNRDELLKRNEYDLLCDIQLGFMRNDICVIDAIINGLYACPRRDEDDFKTCKECIQNWLNREEK